MKPTTTAAPTRTDYFLPEHAHYQLLSVIDHLDFLSRAVASRTADDERETKLKLRPDQLAWCFDLIARQITPVVDHLEGPMPLALH